jgi:hypothetical protein
VSIITAISGLIVGSVGLYMTSHERGRGMGPTGRTPAGAFMTADPQAFRKL